MGTIPNRPVTNAKTTTTTAPRADTNMCLVGDAVKAFYEANGSRYNATIAIITGNTITVNWSNGDPTHRIVASKDTFKNGIPCLGRIESVAGTNTTAKGADIAQNE